jgi:Ni,Fe-hydrogenase III large subunit
VTPRTVGVGAWRDAVAGALRDGRRFAGLWASGEPGAPELRVALTGSGEPVLLRCAPATRFASIIDVAPAAVWDEREAHDLYGARFPAHAPLRPLVDHPSDPAAWTVPVRGPDVHQVAVGPIHAGIIESGHFRFHVVGERILHVDARLFHKHRGLERAAEGRVADEALAYVARACAADAVSNGVAFAQACETARGELPDVELRRGRTLLLELERLYNHLHDLSAMCSGVGLAAGAMAFAALKERAQRVNAALTGHRFLFATVRVGAGTGVAPDAAALARPEVAALGAEALRTWRELAFAASVQDRLEGVGVLTREDALRLGAVGPALRAAGVDDDERLRAPRLWYDGFAAARPDEPTGDVAARVGMRAAELPACLALIDDLLADPPGSGRTQPAGTPVSEALATIESPRGRTLCAVHLDGDVVRRVHLRTGSYANWPVLAHVVPGNLLPDFPLLNKSFELCYACVDR